MNTCTHHLFRKGSIINISCHYQSSYLNSCTSTWKVQMILISPRKELTLLPAQKLMLYAFQYMIWVTYCSFGSFVPIHSLSYSHQHCIPTKDSMSESLSMLYACMYTLQILMCIHKIGRERGREDCAVIKEVNDQTHGCWGQAGTGMGMLCEPTY